MTLVIILAIALALFGLSFLTKRRFGVLGLGLAAGTVLAQTWSREVAQGLEAGKVSVEPLSYSTAATIALIIVPPLLLLIAGPKYTEARYAIIGSTCFAVLGTLLLLGPLTVDMPTLDGTVKDILDFIARWQNLIVAVGIALAIVDTLQAHSPKRHGKKHAKH